MKRVSKLLLTFVLVLTLMTGCVKYNVSMEVKDDKSVTLEIIYGMEVDTSMLEGDTSANTDTDYYEDDTEEDDSSVDVEDYKYLEDAGYKVEEFKEEKEDTVIAGVKVSKTFENIDDITAEEKTTVDFNDLFNEEKKDELGKLKFFYKNGSNYAADFVFDFSTEDDMDYSSYQDMFDLEYKITLPGESISNNATKVSEDKKTLTWDLDYGKKNNVNFEFSVGGDMVMIIIIVVAGVAVVGIIVTLVMGKKKTPQTPAAPLEPVAPVNPGMPDLLAPEPSVPTPVIDPFAQAAPVEPTPAPSMPEESAVMAPTAPVMPEQTPVNDGPAIEFSSPVAPVMQAAPVAQTAAVVEPVNAFSAAPVTPTPVVDPFAQAASVAPTAPVAQAAPAAPTAPVAQAVPTAPVDNNNNGVM